MEHLLRNLAALRERNLGLAERLDSCARGSSVEVLCARSGAVSLSVDGRLESSAEDPEAEAQQLASQLLQKAESSGATRLVLFGMGVHTLPHLAGFDGQILVVEPSLELCRAVLEHVDLSGPLASMDLVVGEDPGPVLTHPLFLARQPGTFLSHTAARRRALAFHDELASRFRPGGDPAPLDIAVIPALFGGTLPIAAAVSRALRQLGHRVREIDLQSFRPAYEQMHRTLADPRLARESSVARAGLVQVIGNMLVSSFELDPPDLVFALAQAPLDPQALAGFRKLGIASSLWFCEDFRVMTYWKEVCRGYDIVFHVQPDDFSNPLREAGGYGVPLAMAFDPEIHRPLELDPRERDPIASDVSFVGAGYHNRRRFLPGLLDFGLRIYGTEWPIDPPFRGVMPEPNARQTAEGCNRIFNATRINLNLHSSPWADGVNPVGDYLNPRTFELAGARAFQLVDRRRLLRDSFEPGLEVETFGDLQECRRKIEYYLGHEDERLEMADRAHRRAHSAHTYRHRMEEAVEAARTGRTPVFPKRRARRTAGAVVESANDEPALAEVMARLDPDTPIDGDAITVAVFRGEGPLNRDEKLLLFTREIMRTAQVGQAGAGG